MIGIVMAGGKGSRMNMDDEKLLLEFKKPIILQVVDSLKHSNCFSKIITSLVQIHLKQKNYYKKIILKFLIHLELIMLMI